MKPTLGGHGGLCPGCRHMEPVRTPRSVFLLCQLSRHDPNYERYPRQPVMTCPGFEPLGVGEAPSDPAPTE